MKKSAIKFKGTPQVEMQFGAANICVGVGQNTETRNPVVTFSPSTGSNGNGTRCESTTETPPVIMEFTSVKSINTIIHQLEVAKGILLAEFMEK
jgi:hypothetical protein